MNNKKRTQTERELMFAQQQVESGNSALANPGINPDVAERVKQALRYWERKVNELETTLGDDSM